jgi:hypothetical protein
MRTTRHFIAALALGALLPVALAVYAQSGGYPTRARFNSIGVGAAPPAGNGGIAVTTVNGIAPSDFARLSQANTWNGGTQISRSTGGTVGWRSNYNDSVFTDFVSSSSGVGYAGTSSNHPFRLLSNNAERIKIAADGSLIELDATVIDSNGVDMTPASGTLTATFDDACGTSPTVTFDYQKIGNVVHLYADATSGFSCTGDSTNFITTGTPVPAAIRPTNASVCSNLISGFFDNGAAAAATLCVNSGGNVFFGRYATFGAGSGAWTAAGVRNVPTAGVNITYTLGDP